MSEIDPLPKDVIIEIQEKLILLTNENFNETIEYIEKSPFFTDNINNILSLINQIITIIYCNWKSLKLYYQFTLQILKDAQKRFSFTSLETDFFNFIDDTYSCYQLVDYSKAAHRLAYKFVKNNNFPKQNIPIEKYNGYDYFFNDPYHEYERKLYKIIITDDIDAFVEKSAIPNFSYDATMYIYAFNRITECYSPSLIDIAAAASSIKIFKTIALSSPSSITVVTLKYAITSGNLEMVRICLQNDIQPDWYCFKTSVKFHRNEIYDWLKDLLFEPGKKNRYEINTNDEIIFEDAITSNNFYVYFDLHPMGISHLIRERVMDQIVFSNHIEMLKNVMKYNKMESISWCWVQNYKKTVWSSGSLFWAVCKKKNQLITQIILSRKDEISFPFENLLIAAVSNNVPFETIKLILEFEPNAISKSVIHFAALNNRIDCIDYYKKINITKFDLKQEDEYSKPLLLNLLELEYYDTFMYLCKNYSEFIDFNERDEFLTSVLEKAVKYDYLDGVKEILKHPEVDVNCANTFSDNWTPFHFSILHRSIKSINYFLYENEKVDVNCKDINGQTPLVLALLKKKNNQIIKMLLDSPKIDVNSIANNGLTPLSIAVKNGEYEYVNMLLNHRKIDINAGLQTPLEIAAKNNQKNIVQLLLERKDLDMTKITLNCELLSYFPNEEAFNLITSLVKKGYDINKCDINGESLLHKCILSKSTEFAKFLLSDQIRANPTLLDKKESLYPLHLCAKVGEIEIAQILLNNQNINPNIEGIYDRTPMHIAALNNQYEFIEKLSNHFDTNKKDERNSTPLDIAINKHYTKVVESLCMDPKTKIRSKSYLNKTPLRLASIYHYEDICLTLKKYISIRAKAKKVQISNTN